MSRSLAGYELARTSSRRTCLGLVSLTLITLSLVAKLTLTAASTGLRSQHSTRPTRDRRSSCSRRFPRFCRWESIPGTRESLPIGTNAHHRQSARTQTVRHDEGGRCANVWCACMAVGDVLGLGGEESGSAAPCGEFGVRSVVKLASHCHGRTWMDEQ